MAAYSADCTRPQTHKPPPPSTHRLSAYPPHYPTRPPCPAPCAHLQRDGIRGGELRQGVVGRVRPCKGLGKKGQGVSGVSGASDLSHAAPTCSNIGLVLWDQVSLPGMCWLAQRPGASRTIRDACQTAPGTLRPFTMRVCGGRLRGRARGSWAREQPGLAAAVPPHAAVPLAGLQGGRQLPPRLVLAVAELTLPSLTHCFHLPPLPAQIKGYPTVKAYLGGEAKEEYRGAPRRVLFLTSLQGRRRRPGLSVRKRAGRGPPPPQPKGQM